MHSFEMFVFIHLLHSLLLTFIISITLELGKGTLVLES